jgi:hypothetical protein
MTSPGPGASADCLAALESALSGGPRPDLARFEEDALEDALRELTRRHGAGAAPLLRELAGTGGKPVRRAVRRALYRIGEQALTAPASQRPVVARDPIRAMRAWLSGIDGAGSRAAWIVFEGGLGGGQWLCSLILNDAAGIMDVAGGAITRKRLDAELAKLYRDQKLPWVETAPTHVSRLVHEALARHRQVGTEPPAGFARWTPFFEATPAPAVPEPATVPDPALVERSADLLDLPDLGGWFADPATIAEEAVSLLEMRDSRLVVPDQVKAEREAAIVDRVLEKTFGPDVRPRWARRLEEMAIIFRATHREDAGRIAAATARAIGDLDRQLRWVPLTEAMARRGLEIAADVALGRVRLDDVRRSPGASGRA